MAKISIVTPNYNYAQYLDATIKSVLEQSYPNLEYIVIDDGSTDHSVKVIQQYSDRLAFWRTGPNQGQYKAITEGLNRATGDVLGWINSDDMHMPWTLRAVASIFGAFPEVEWISSLRPATWDCEGLCYDVASEPGFSREAYLDGVYLTRRFIQQESTFWRRSLWEKAGRTISSDFGAAGDFDLWGRFFEHTELVGVTIPLAGFRFQHSQKTSNIQKYTQSCLQSLSMARRRAPSRRQHMARRLTYAARLHLMPKIQNWAKKALGYEGRRIRRVNPAGPKPSWVLESYRFL